MPAIDPFEAERKALQGLMGENGFFIPDLQRPFSWGEEQVEDLLNDINGVLRASKESELDGGSLLHGHFLGTIVTQHEPGRNRLAILDGQQRLTCLTLLIALVAAEASALRQRCTNSADETRVGIVVTELERLILLPPDGFGNRAPRLEASPEIRRSLVDFVLGGSGEVAAEVLAPALNLRKAASLIRSSLLTEYRELAHEQQIQYLNSLRQCICEQLLTIHMSTRAGSAAFSIFESLNARGEPLAMLDLLKIWVMSEMMGHPQEQEVTEILRELATSRFAEDEPDKYFETYFTIRNNGVRPKAKGSKKEKLFSIEFRDNLLIPLEPTRRADKALTQVAIVNTFRHAKKIRPLYDSIANRQQRAVVPFIHPYPVEGGTTFQQDRLETLIGPPLRHQLAIPLLVRAAEVFEDRPDAMHALVHDVERLFFRLKIISQCHAQVLYHAYKSIFDAFEDGSHSDTARRAKFKTILSVHSPDNAFASDLRQRMRYSSNTSGAIKYFLWMLELYSANNPPATKTFDLTNLSIEHIYPQSGDPDALEGGEDDLHRLGNLCLLTPPENSSLSNRSFVEKRAKVLEWTADRKLLECHHSQSVFNDNDRWGTPEIEQTESKLCEQAIQIFSF